MKKDLIWHKRKMRWTMRQMVMKKRRRARMGQEEYELKENGGNMKRGKN